jgi:hypothetical protein
VKPEARHVGLAACAGEGLAHGVAAHWLAVTADENTVRPGPFAHVGGKDGQHVRRNRDGALTASVLGGASKARRVSRSSTRLVRTVTVPASRSMSCGVRAMISPRRSPHHAPSRTAARYLGVMDSMSATTWATEATGRFFGPLPGRPDQLGQFVMIATAYGNRDRFWIRPE